MKKIARKLLSTLLAFVMVIGLIPASTLTAFAAGNVVVTHDVDEIRELLQQDGDVSIKLDADAEKKLTAYSDFENYKNDNWNSQYVWTKIGSGNKTIDLNGYRLYVYDQSARSLGSLEWMDFRYIQGALLMEIPDGASLTVNDSSGGGKIWMDAEMPDKSEIEGSDLLMERNIFAVTGGDLTVNGGEIHAGRSKEIYAQSALKHDKDYRPIYDFTGYFYSHLYGYATWFLSGTAITAESGNVTINGGDIWGRGWDNWTLITRVPGAPNGADDFRDRCAALRLLGSSTAHIAGGNFYGRSDADAVQVSNPNNLTVDAGSFDVATNSWLVVPGVDLGGTSDAINDVFFHDSVFEVHEGYLGSFGVPTECINDQSVKVTKGNTMTISKNAIDPYIVIDDLNLYVNAPLDYGDISEEVYRVPEGCTVESVTWYKNGAKIENPESTYFQEGQRYSVYIALSVDIQTGTKFTNRLNNATINGKEAVLNRVDDENLIMSVDFGYCTAALEELEFEVIEPEEGQYSNVWVGSKDYALYDAVGNFGEFRQWYVSDDGETYTEKSSDDTFEAGKYYRFSFEVHVGEGQEFAVDASDVSVQPDVTATVNGILSATVTKTYEQDPSEHITVTVDFGKCPARVSHVELTVTAPKEGETINYGVGSAHDTYYAIGDSSNYTDYRQWYESDTGYDNWRVMSPGETFTGGKYYKFVTDVYTKAGYEYPTYDNGTSIMPGVNAYVNSYAANVTKGYEQDPARYITVEYFFGICNDSVVENIIIENVTEPVAGQKPNYNWSIRGSGYQMNTAKNAYYDVYWKNPPEKWYYIKNGIGWFDMTEWDWVYENETFIPGHEYQVRVYLITENGYEFAHSKYYDPTVTATINGNAAEAFTSGSDCTWSQQVQYTFTCAQPEINTIMLYNLDAPVVGETPDTEVTAAYPELYEVTNVQWLDEEDSVVNSFEQGRLYTAEIIVSAKDYDGVDGCIFADSVTAYIDGKEVTGWSNKVTVNNDNTLTVRYGFRKGASAPIGNPYVFVTQPTGGTVNTGQTHTAYWQTTFIPTQTEIQYWDGEVWDQWDVQQAQAAVDSYDFVSVDAGSYRFRIVAYIGNDAVATSDEFLITWEETPVNKYTVSFNANGGTGTMADVTGMSGDYMLPSCAFTAPAGKKFKCWAEGSINGTQYYAGYGCVVDSDVTFYAIWEELPHTHKYDKLVAEDIYKVSPATCTKKAVYYKSCACGEKGTATFETGSLSAHKYTKVTTKKATMSKNGYVQTSCAACGDVKSKKTVYYAKSFALSTTSYTYNGKVKTPSVTVKDANGTTLKKDTDYTVTYASGRKSAGTYKVTVKMKGNYTGIKTLTFKINPTKTTVSKLTAAKKSLKVTIKKKSTQVTGYQIQYSTSKKFTKSTTKTKTVKSYKTTSTTLKSLKSKKTYYVRVRTYKTVSGKKYYSGWSTIKYKKTK